MMPIEFVPKTNILSKNRMSFCQQDISDTFFTKENQRGTTENWLNGKIKELNLNFHYFITLSFYKGNKSTLNQYKDNQHIKKVILDFFYPNKKPNDKIRIWFFVEKHLSGYLHLHILMEGIDGLSWLIKNNRKITLSKKTLFDIIANDYSIDDVITEALTNHLKSYIYKLGNGKKSTDIRNIGKYSQRVHYVNKSLQSLDFDGWEHIDFENSDL